MRADFLIVCVACVIALSIAEGPAWGDEGEFSLGMRADCGVVRVGSAAAARWRSRVPATALVAEVTYAEHDFYQYRLGVGYGGQWRLGRNRVPAMGMAGDDEEEMALLRRGRLLRVEGGVTFRLTPPIWTPTIHLGLLAEADLGGAREVAGVGLWGSRNPHAHTEVFDFAARLGVGLDYRLDAHWIFGSVMFVEQGLRKWRQRRGVFLAFHVSVSKFGMPV